MKDSLNYIKDLPEDQDQSVIWKRQQTIRALSMALDKIKINSNQDAQDSLQKT